MEILLLVMRCVRSTLSRGSWGNNWAGQLNVPLRSDGGTYRWKMISAGGDSTTCGVTTSGEGFCWGCHYNGPLNIPSGHTWASIVAGRIFTCGVNSLGEGYCWASSQGLKRRRP